MANNVNQARLDCFYWTLLVLMCEPAAGCWGAVAAQHECAALLPLPLPSEPGVRLPQPALAAAALPPPCTLQPPLKAVLNFLAFLAVAARFRYRVLPHATAGVELATGDAFRLGTGLGPTLSRRLSADLRSGQLRPDTLHRELTAGRLSGRSSLVLRRAVERSGLAADAAVQPSRAATAPAAVATGSRRQASMLQTATA